MVLLCDGCVQYIILRNLYTDMDPSVVKMNDVDIQNAKRSCTGNSM